MVTSGEVAVFAQFRESQDDRFAPELAAYRLDRMLGLGMVPVVTRREINGQPGTLQLVPANSVNDAELVAIKARIGAPCSLDKQSAAMRVFDALIGNPARTPSTMLYDPEELELILVGHDAAFGTAWPGHSAHAELTVGKDWQIALRELDGAALRDALGDVLDGQQLAELEQRRDALLNNSND